MINLSPVIDTVFAETGSASSTTHNLSVAWPYVLVSVLVVLSLIGTAVTILRNQSNDPLV